MSERQFVSFDGTELYLKTEMPENARCAVVIVHGLCEHQGRYDYVAERFHKEGIGTYRFDHRGHGRSSGERAHYDDFNQLIDDVNAVVELALAENPTLPVFVLGHSMGGFGVSIFGAKYPGKRIRGIITSGALTRDRGNLISGLPTGLDVHMRLPNELGSGVCSVAEVVDWYGKDPYNGKSYTPGLCYALIAGVKWFGDNAQSFDYPVLMLHGEKDGLVSVQDSIEGFGMISSTDKQLKIYGNLFHEIFNEYCKAEVVTDVIRWIETRL